MWHVQLLTGRRVVEMPADVWATLKGYVPLDANDDTVELLRETFKHLPSDGRHNLAENIIQADE